MSERLIKFGVADAQVEDVHRNRIEFIQTGEADREATDQQGVGLDRGPGV